MEKIYTLMKSNVVTLTALLFIVVVSLLRAVSFQEGDIFWGARNGIETLEHGIEIWQVDTWNFQTLGEEWSSNSWLWNVALGGFYQAFGNYGFFLLTLITNMLAYGFLWSYLQKLRIAPLTALSTLMGCWVVMTMFMNGRSNTADLAILAIFLYLSLTLAKKPVWLLASAFLLTVLWLNLHLTGVAAVGLFPALVYAMLYQEEQKKRLSISVLTMCATFVALPLTPFGLQGLLKVSLVQSESKDLIIEWSSVFSNVGANTGIIFLLISSLVLVFFTFWQRQFVYSAFLLVLIYGTADMIRLAPFLLIATLGAYVFFADKENVIPEKYRDLKRPFTYLLIVVTLILTIISGFSLARIIEDDQKMFYISSEELSLIPAHSRVALSQDAGSMAILYRPDVLVSLDGRNDLLGRERYIEASNIRYAQNLNQLEKWLTAHDVDTVFVESNDVGADVIDSNMQKLKWVKRTNSTRAFVYTKP